MICGNYDCKNAFNRNSLFSDRCLYFFTANPRPFFKASRSGKVLTFQYDHDFSSNAFYTLKIEYNDNGFEKRINVTDKPMSGKIRL